MSMELPPPPVIGGRFRYTRKGSDQAVLRFEQPDKNAKSVLHLSFHHKGGGTLYGTMHSGQVKVADQCGSFSISSTL